MKTYRIETDRLVVRCWEPSDAARLKEAVDISVDHLLPWLPWAAGEPQTIEEKIALLRGFRSSYDRGEDYILGIFDREDRTALGGSGLHTRIGPNEREIGYWVRADRAGQGIVTEAVEAICHVAFAIEAISRLEIRCDPKNEPSRRVAERVGFCHETTLRRRSVPGFTELRDTEIYSLYPEDIGDRPRRFSTEMRCFDAAGQEIILP